MTLKKNFAVFLFIILAFQLLGSSDSSFVSRLKPSAQSSVFLFTAGYRMPVSTAPIINSGHGLYFEAGINPGHLVSKRLVLGFFAGWAWKDRLWATSFNNEFVKDYQSSINLESHFSSLDSSVIASSADLFAEKKGTSLPLPGCEMRSFHNYSLYYGAIVRLPYRYMPAVKVYMGLIGTYLQAGGDEITKQKEYNILQLKRAMYGCELILFRGLQSVAKQNSKYPLHKNTGTISIYYESSDIYDSRLQFYDGEQETRIPLKRFVSDSFLQKYARENIWGVKFAFSIM